MKGSPFFEDMAKMATGATGAMMEMRKEIELLCASQMERFASSAQLVTREEFEAVKEMAANLYTENEALKARLEKLEGAPKKKPAAKKK